MKTRQSTGYFQQVSVVLLLCFVSSFISASSAFALTNGKIDACYDCHGSPGDIRPLDSTIRDITNGAFVGNHRTHVSTLTSTSACATCHGPAPTTMDHRDGKIYVNNGSIKNGTYTKGPFFNQTSMPTLGSCSGVNCHFNTVTPTWGINPTWSSTKTANDLNTNCAACHSASTLATGKHSKHIIAGGGTQAACNTCHPDYNALAGTNAFQHATSAARPINVNFSATPNLGGSYAGGRTGTQFLPGGPAATGTCSALYCHSPGNKASSYDPPNTTPVTWSTSLDCKGCHKAEALSGAEMSSGSHTSHVNNTGLGYTTIKCVTCHASTVNASMTISDVTKHVNKSVDVAFANSSSAANGSYNGSLAKPGSPSSKAPGSLAGNCQNVYCHSAGQHSDGTALVAGDYQTPTWGTPLGGKCGTCHGVTGSTSHGGFPGAINPSAQIASGKHTKHLSYVYGITDLDMKCAICHAYDKTAFSTSAASCGTTCHGSSPNNTGAKHSNYEVNVNIANYVGSSATYSGSLKPGDGYGSCSLVYCHSDGQTTPTYAAAISWSAAGPLACNACHGFNVGTGAPIISTNKHTAHVNNAGILGTNYTCGDCHAMTVAQGTDSPLTSTTTHVNKFVEYSGAKAFKSGYTVGSLSTCTTACHSSGKKGLAIAGVVIEPANPSWNAVAQPLDCKGCHGVSTGTGTFISQAGEPNYPSQGINVTGSNNHQKHVGIAGASTCANCHSKTTTTGTTLIAGGQHIDRFVNYTAGNGKTFGKLANKTCSNISCHSGSGIVAGVASAQWGANLGCSGCHGDAGTLISGTHPKHLALSGVTCNYCHNATASNNTTIGTPANHLNSSITINFNPSAAPAGGTYNGLAAGGVSVYQKANGLPAGACGTSLCHGGNSGTWGVVNNDATCVKCHGVAGTTPAQYTANNDTAAPGYNGTGVNTAGTTGTVTGGVSNDSKVGAHDTHLKGTGGFKTNGIVCADCHAVTAIGDADHMNGSTTMTWSSLAKNIGTVPYNADNGAVVPGYNGTSCSTNYCHGGGFAPAVQGTGTTVAWTDGAYLANAGSVMNFTDCNKCHQSPPTSSVKFAHGGITLGPGNCSGCHNHDGYGDARHINGTLEATGGSCNACHSYDTVGGVWGNGTHKDGAVEEGWGAHAKHIDNLKATLVVSLNPDSDAYGSAVFKQVCGACHSSSTSDHSMGNGNARNINFDNRTTYRFGAVARPFYNGSSAVPSVTKAKTCANVSCHFNATPRWQ